jgi:tetratricopeptide (TPR) repeat protein
MSSKLTVAVLQRNMQKALKQGQLEEAEEILTRLKQEDPLSRETRGFELEYYLEADRLIDAEALASQLHRMFPDSARILFLCGKLAYRLKHYVQAEAYFRESHRLHISPLTQLWLGKTFTQTGQWDQAEATLLAVRNHYTAAHLDLGWLYERKGDWKVALAEYEAYLQLYPHDEFALQQQMRLKAKMLEPQELVEEFQHLAELGEAAPDTVFPEYVRTLFETGETRRARDEVQQRMDLLEPRLGMQLAWVCYQAHAYDLSCTLFLKFVERNLSNFKYLTALEAAGSKCHRLEEIVQCYRNLAGQNPKLHGRIKALRRRIQAEQ